MSKVVWKGSIAFSLVSIPVNLYPAAGANELDLHLLDRRDFSGQGGQKYGAGRPQTRLKASA